MPQIEIDPLTGERKTTSGNYKIDPSTGERIEEATAPQTLTSQVLGVGKDLAKGVGEGVLNTLSSGDEFARKHLPAFFTNSNFGFGKPADLEKQKELTRPVNTAQSIGKGLEQAGEFLIPGAAEKSLLGKAPVAARIAGSALSSGIVNKVQGGDFKTGALAGGVGGAIGEGVRAVAPKIAESAIGLRKTDRAYKAKNAVGRALLDETKGYTPESVGESAQKVLDKLNPELESTIAASPNSVSLTAPRKVVSDAVDTSVKRGARKSYGQLQPVAEHLDRDIFNTPIANDIPAIDALNLNRGLADDFVGSWNPETLKNVSGTAAKAYHELGEGIKAAVPESRPLYSRIANLIPVENRASGAALNASTTQKIVHRIGAPTGALTGSVFGGYKGYQEGGVAGGIGGAIAGLALPVLTTTPTGQIALARFLNSAGAKSLIRGTAGLGLQLNRPSDQAKGE